MKKIVKKVIIFSISLVIFSTSLMSADIKAKTDEEYRLLYLKELVEFLNGKEARVNFEYPNGTFKIYPYDDNKELIVYNDNEEEGYLIDKYPDYFLTFPFNGEKLRLFAKSGVDTGTGRGYGFMDKDENVVVEPKYELGDLMFSSVAIMGNFRDGGGIDYDLVNDEGKVVTDKKYRFISRFMMPKSYLSYDSRYTFDFFNSDFFKDYTPLEYAYFMHDVSPRYDLVIRFDNSNLKYPNHWGAFAGKKGLMDKSGKEILPDVYYDILIGEGDIIGIAKEVNKYGYVNSKGETVLPMQYQMASRFKNNMAAIVRDDKIAFIDKDLNLIQDFKEAFKWRRVYQVGDIDALTLAYYDKANYSGSNWAREYILLAESINIIPEELKTKYKSKITRKEFCELLLNAILLNSLNKDNIKVEEQMQIIQKATSDKSPVPFKDTDDRFVELAYKLGIVNGKSKDVFDPNGAITRQEAAAMLIRVYRLFGDTSYISAYDKYYKTRLEEKFNDYDDIADWAKKDVFYSNEIGLMNGVGSKLFDPKGTYTVEQSITTIIRLYEGI